MSNHLPTPLPCRLATKPILVFLSLLIHLTLLHTSSAQTVPTDTGRACWFGEYHDGNGCLRCPPGTFAPTINSFTCTPCPPTKATDKDRTSCRTCDSPTTFVSPARICEECPVGTYLSKPVSKPPRCIPCPPGHSTRHEGATSKSECFSCGVGEYPSSVGCSPCPSGSYSNKASVLKCKPCPLGTGTPRFMTNVCKPCPRGTYGIFSEFNNRTSCPMCPKGTYSTPGSTSCSACPRHTVGNNERTRCSSACKPGTDRCPACPAGQQAKNPNATVIHPNRPPLCEPCPGNTINPPGSATPCTKCPPLSKANKSRTKCTCVGNRAWHERREECRTCPAGSVGVHSPVGKICKCGAGRQFDATYWSCLCAPGTSRKSADDDTCIPCTAEIRKTIGDWACNGCEGWGRYYDAKWRICRKCPRGTTSGRLHEGWKCEPCGKLQYVDGKGRVHCGCKPGTYPAGGACIPCEAGLEWDFENKRCRNCAPGWYSDKWGLLKCKRCPAGRDYSLKRGATSCPDVCPTNTIPNYETGTCECKRLFRNVGRDEKPVCEKCPKGTVGNLLFGKCICEGPAVWKGGKCALCPAGEYADRMEVCRKCPKLMISVAGGECTFCPDGTYSMTEGGTKCVSCPDGEFVTKKNGCGKCAGGYRVRNGECVKCWDGFVSDGGNMAFCRKCGEGMKASADGRKCLPAAVS